MSYSILSSMRQSPGLMQRITACAAQEGIDYPDNWTQTNAWKLIKGADWVSAYVLAEEKKHSKFNPDTGARNDVITDAMILASVQAVRSTEA